jgi:hypothetical protein
MQSSLLATTVVQRKQRAVALYKRSGSWQQKSGICVKCTLSRPCCAAQTARGSAAGVDVQAVQGSASAQFKSCLAAYGHMPASLAQRSTKSTDMLYAGIAVMPHLKHRRLGI